jgi:hypothetical protein
MTGLGAIAEFGAVTELEAIAQVAKNQKLFL